MRFKESLVGACDVLCCVDGRQLQRPSPRTRNILESKQKPAAGCFLSKHLLGCGSDPERYSRAVLRVSECERRSRLALLASTLRRIASAANHVASYTVTHTYAKETVACILLIAFTPVCVACHSHVDPLAHLADVRLLQAKNNQAGLQELDTHHWRGRRRRAGEPPPSVNPSPLLTPNRTLQLSNARVLAVQ